MRAKTKICSGCGGRFTPQGLPVHLRYVHGLSVAERGSTVRPDGRRGPVGFWLVFWVAVLALLVAATIAKRRRRRFGPQEPRPTAD